MKYLIPALTSYLEAMIFKHKEYMSSFTPSLVEITKHLMSKDIRMEKEALIIGNAIFEKIGLDSNPESLKSFLF